MTVFQQRSKIYIEATFPGSQPLQAADMQCLKPLTEMTLCSNGIFSRAPTCIRWLGHSCCRSITRLLTCIAGVGCCRLASLGLGAVASVAGLLRGSRCLLCRIGRLLLRILLLLLRLLGWLRLLAIPCTA